MIHRIVLRRALAAGALALFLAPTLTAAAQSSAQAGQAGSARASSPGAPAPKPLNLEDYGRFNRIAGTALSPDGKWLSYTVTPNDGTGVLYIRQLDSDKLITLARGSSPQFNETSRYVAYFEDPPAGGRGGRGGAAPGGGGRGGRGTTPPQAAPAAAAAPAPARSFVIMDLQSGTTSTIPGVGSFSFSPDGEWILLRPVGAAGAAPAAGAGGGRGGRGGAAPAADDGGTGSDILMRNLATGMQRPIGNVGQSSFNDDGKFFAFTVRGANRLGNGVYVMTMATGEQRMLDNASEDYDQLNWSTNGENLAVMRGEQGARQGAARQRDHCVDRRDRSIAGEDCLRSGQSDGIPERNGGERICRPPLERRREAPLDWREGPSSRVGCPRGRASERRRLALERSATAVGADHAGESGTPFDIPRRVRSRVEHRCAWPVTARCARSPRAAT